MVVNKIVIWLKPNGSYYHRIVKGTYSKYELGTQNQYKHRVVHVIEDYSFYSSRLSFLQSFKFLLKRLLKNFISFLEKLLKKL